jgi:stearoyl-CoA desaturase (delta-9 desaturase)
MNPHWLDLAARGLTGAPMTWVVVAFVLCAQLTILSVTLYLHRSQAHRGVDFHPLLSHLFRFWAWFTTAMVTKEWVAIHRKHHAKCETEEDPHSPLIYGMSNVAIHGVVLYQKACQDRPMIEKYGVGTPDDWIERNVYSRYSALGPTLLLFTALALGGAVGLAWWALLMLVIPVFAAGGINGLGHGFGYRNFETSDRSTNLTPWAFLLGGEELHNNHHAFPSSARFALRKFEFDIGWATLRLFERLRLAKVLRVAPKLALRPEVALPDAETVRAVLAHRFAVLSGYFRNVTLPAFRADAARAGASMEKMSRSLRRALSSDGRWLDSAGRERLAQWISERPLTATVVEHRRRLAALLERSGKSSEELLNALKDWCRDAEASGIESLKRYAEQLRGYALSPA